MSASASASPCFRTKRRPRRPWWRLEPWTEATPPLDRRWVFLPSPDRTAARGIARPHPRRTSHRLYPAVHKAEEEKHSVLLFCVAHDQQFLARGRSLPAPPPSGMPSPPGPPCPPPRCALAARTMNTSFVLWHGLETPGKRFSAPSVSLSETIFTPDAMWWCQPAVSFPGPRQKCLDVNIGQPAGGPDSC